MKYTPPKMAIVVGKAVEVQIAANALEKLQADKSRAQDRVQQTTIDVAAQLTIVQNLVAEMKTLINE